MGRVETVLIKGVEVEDTTVEYRVTNNAHTRIYKQESLFAVTEREEAIKECTRLAMEQTTFEAERITRKVREAKTWAWNASYHRKQLKEAIRQQDYHTKALDYANSKGRV